MSTATLAGDAAARGDSCRLCSGHCSFRFELAVLGRHRVAYFRCNACGSLQTEEPYWLDEAYGGGNLSGLDTGAAQRNLDNLAIVIALSRLLGLRRVLDIGGGDGLLCRLLRDRGVNAFAQDRHARPTYTQGFESPDFEQPDFVLAFEVLEHFSRPAEELTALFAGSPKALLFSTDLYADQGPDWWYLAPESGQHVFFYSRQALADLAARQGYALIARGSYLLFLRQGQFGSLQRRLAKLLLKPRLRRLERLYAVGMPTPGVMRDHERQLARLRGTTPLR